MQRTSRNWFWREIVFTDLSRGLIYSIILLFINSAFMIGDLVRFSRGMFADNRSYFLLFICHVALFVVLIVFLVLYYILRPSAPDAVDDKHSAMVVGLASIILIYCTVVSLIDQTINGQITVYVVGCMSIAVAFFLPPMVTIVMYVANHLGFLAGLYFLSLPASVFSSHLTSGTIVAFLAIVITRLMFGAQRRVYQGISVIQSQQEKLERMATEDSLTGLYNRRYADSRLADEFERSVRYSRSFSVAMADIDHFKQVNDRFLHSVGDEVLRKIATLLRAELRAVDVVARYGGEEFIVMFPETDEASAFTVCEKMRRAIEQFRWGEIASGLAVTISFGVAGMGGCDEPECVVRNADDRLYTAKNSGRNLVVGAS